MDSNVFGPVAKGLITAQAKCIIWPPRRWRFLPPEYPPDRKVFPFSPQLTSPAVLSSPTSSSLSSTPNSSSSSTVGELEAFQWQQPLHIEIRDHRSRIDDAHLFMDACQID